MIRWLYKPSGFAPVQAEGYFLGYFFYFRSQWETATIDFALSPSKWAKRKTIRIELKKTQPFEASWISKRQAIFLIYYGCLQFIFKNKDILFEPENDDYVPFKDSCKRISNHFSKIPYNFGNYNDIGSEFAKALSNSETPLNEEYAHEVIVGFSEHLNLSNKL